MRKPLLLLLLAAAPAAAEMTSLDLGLDYRLRGVSISNNDMQPSTKDTLAYYTQSARFYMRAWLNEDVEASLRLHAINIWGMEGSNSLATVYPNVAGTPWVEEGYIHMPNMLNKHLDLTLGRQPILIGDGMLVSSDDHGFNALRARLKLPLKTEMDLFTVKAAESLNGHHDADLVAAVFRAQQEDRHWDLGVFQESNGEPSPYVLGPSTYTANRVTRRFYDGRLFGDLVGAYYKIEVAMQSGDATLAPTDTKIKIKGLGERLELGAQKDTEKWGRFGVKALFAQGTGDDSGSQNTDEAFRPTYARRWDGLERSGFGSYYGATLSDAYDPSHPFDSSSTGLPLGVSGIRTMGLGLFSTQKVFWTGSLDYYTYNALVAPAGLKDLGAELDLGITYRYTGFVTFDGGVGLFFPGTAYGQSATRVVRTTFAAHVHF